MKRVSVAVVFALCVLACSANATPLGNLFGMMLGNNLQDSGGSDCAACTILVALVEQVAQVNNQTVDQTLSEICNLFPAEIKNPCQALVMLYGPAIIKYIDLHYTADEVCYVMNLCHNQTCHIFPKRKAAQESRVPLQKIYIQPFDEAFPNFGKWEWPWTKVSDHFPAEDLDGDHFSTEQTLRGTNWRGKDCQDLYKEVYPGRAATNFPSNIDHNCNGIVGTDPKTGKSWEQLLCSGTKQYGYVLLGDSAGAHFHIPPQWLTATDINEAIFKDMLPILSDEFDWPEMSSATGYMNNTWAGHPEGPVDSGYARMRLRNLCMHRDYQNIAVNGARSSSMMSSIITTMARNQTLDHPVMLTYSLIGNDVCNPHYGMDHMTTPQEFYVNVVNALNYLDKVLPAGSRVSFLGLVDGRVLYDAMATRIHPLGSTNNDITYAQFYDYMNCLEISPCFGWMNTDGYWRNATTQRAMQLNEVYKQIIANHTFVNFNMTYFDTPLPEVLDRWTKSGGQIWQLIEPVDGFHPNQITNALLTQVMWEAMITNYTYLVPPINPNNAQISQLFGNQGGY